MNRRQFLQTIGSAALSAHPVVASAPETFVARYVYRTNGVAYSITDVEMSASAGRLYARHLARSMIETRETLVANLLNRAFEP